MTTTHATDASLDAQWMPFTPNRAFKSAPRMLVRAKGMYYTAVDGRQILDGTSGLWCVNAGHCREPIVEAIAKAAGELDYAPGFNMGHPLAFELADKLAQITPTGLDRVFFTGSGSEAVDTALKIVLAYHRARGEEKRVRFVGREKGYHGVGFGGISVGGLENNKKAFAAQLLPSVSHIRHTHDAGRNAFSNGMPQHGAEFADDLERIVAEYGGETVAAVIVEPMSGSAGVFVPPVGSLNRLRDICTRHGILLIFDEVITGFGRTGAAFASDVVGVVPDMMTLAKGLTNGAVPMGAVAVSRAIHDAVVDGAPGGIELFHGYTYSGHPLACAAGIATLELYRSEGLFERAAELAPYWESAVHSLRDAPGVVDVRNMGLVAGIELESRAGAVGARAMEVFLKCFERGVLVRVTGDTIALSPPLIIEKGQVDEVVNTIAQALHTAP
ncbi:MAG: aspartate aminotransferase family protein [Gemmatimonadaceae bacterium]